MTKANQYWRRERDEIPHTRYFDKRVISLLGFVAYVNFGNCLHLLKVSSKFVTLLQLFACKTLQIVALEDS